MSTSSKTTGKMTMGLIVGNRGFFPDHLAKTGREEMMRVLQDAGIDVVVLEQAPAFTAIGAGLGLQVNATRALTHVGGDRYWRETSARIDAEHTLGLESGALISAVPSRKRVIMSRWRRCWSAS